eukprot:ctg_333.g166
MNRAGWPRPGTGTATGIRAAPSAHDHQFRQRTHLVEQLRRRAGDRAGAAAAAGDSPIRPTHAARTPLSGTVRTGAHSHAIMAARFLQRICQPHGVAAHGALLRHRQSDAARAQPRRRAGVHRRHVAPVRIRSRSAAVVAAADVLVRQPARHLLSRPPEPASARGAPRTRCAAGATAAQPSAGDRYRRCARVVRPGDPGVRCGHRAAAARSPSHLDAATGAGQRALLPRRDRHSHRPGVHAQVLRNRYGGARRHVFRADRPAGPRAHRHELCALLLPAAAA